MLSELNIDKIYFILIYSFSNLFGGGISAGVAQLVEQLICNQQVAGSSPITSF